MSDILQDTLDHQRRAFLAAPAPPAAAHTFRASTVGATSCTRTMRAPCDTAARAAAKLAASRSPTGRPVNAPSDDLRDQPISKGCPSAVSCA